MPDKERDNHRETTPYPDGKKEGILNDPTGLGFGIMLDDNVINPAEITYMNKDKNEPKED